MKEQKSVAIIGAGMAGLSAAYQLQELGFSVTVFEKTSNVGGRSISLKKSGYTMDLGALTLSPAYKETIRLLTQVGAIDDCRSLKPVLAIVRNGALHNIDLANAIKTGLSSKFLSFRAKLKLIKLLPTMIKYWSRCDFEDMSQLAELDTETCESFALRVLGQEVHDFLIDPLIRVNMFTSSQSSSAVDLIWLLKIFANPELLQVTSGMGSMSQSVANKLQDVRINSDVTRVEKFTKGVVVTVTKSENDENTRQYEFDGAVIATPVAYALQIAPWITGRQQQWFADAQPVASMTVHIGLQCKPDTQAALIMVPTSEAQPILGIAMEHNKCPERAPKDKGLIALHMSAAWAKDQQGLSELAIAQRALDIASPFLGDLKDKIEMVNLHHWQWVDHQREVGIYRALAEARPEFTRGRVTFAGEYNAAGIEGAVRSGKLSANALAKSLS